MKKRVNIQHDEGVLILQGNFKETVLYANQLPIQYTWFAEIGSTWRYHIARSLPPHTIKENKENQELVKRGIKSTGDFYEIVNYYKQFLGRGEYEFGYYKLHKYHAWINIPKGKTYQSFDYYGGCPDIIPTQNNINEELVNMYAEQIRNGLKPVLVVLHNEGSHIEFILDGHHKFLAYNKLKMEPYAVIITKLGETNINVAEALELLHRMNCSNPAFIEIIKEQKEDTPDYLRMDLSKTYVEID